MSAWPRSYCQSGRLVVAARLLQRAAGSTSTVHHGAVAAGHECSSASRLKPPVTGPRHTGTDRAALVADNSSSPVQTVSARHSAVVGTAPDYLKNMLHPMSERAPQRALRSATNNDMVVPHSRLKFGERAFSIAAPRAWNTTVFLPICAPH